MAGKYTPLAIYLKDRPSAVRDITLSFVMIETIINDRLPKSAKGYREWWSNELKGSHVQAHGWMNAGWKLEGVDLVRQTVRFTRA